MDDADIEILFADLTSIAEGVERVDALAKSAAPAAEYMRRLLDAAKTLHDEVKTERVDNAKMRAFLEELAKPADPNQPDVSVLEAALGKDMGDRLREVLA